MESLSKIVDKFCALVKQGMQNVDDLTAHKIYRSLREKEVEGYNGDPFGDSIMEFVDVEDIKEIGDSIAPRLIEKELKQSEPNPHLLTDVFPYLNHDDQLRVINEVPRETLWAFAESIHWSYVNYSDVLYDFYKRAENYYREKGHDKMSENMAGVARLIESKYGEAGRGSEGKGEVVDKFYEMLNTPRQQAIRESDDRLVEITEEGDIEPVPAEVIDIRKRKVGMGYSIWYRLEGEEESLDQFGLPKQRGETYFAEYVDPDASEEEKEENKALHSEMKQKANEDLKRIKMRDDFVDGGLFIREYGSPKSKPSSY